MKKEIEKKEYEPYCGFVVNCGKMLNHCFAKCLLTNV